MRTCFVFLLAFSLFLQSCGSKANSSNVNAVSFEQSSDNSDFVMLTDVVADVILEMRYFSTYNFVGTRIDGYNVPVALCTREAAEALKVASDNLGAMGYRLLVFDAYRPQSAVDHFLRWARDVSDTAMKQVFYPHLNKNQIIPQNYLASHSGHTRGSTFDLTLFDVKTGREVDMGSPFDFFGSISHPDCRTITDEQYKNRMILRNAMIQAGFRPLESEWWHFTLRKEPFPNTYFTFPVEPVSFQEKKSSR